MTGEDLARAAAALCGTPFRLNGRDRTHGIDCIGLLELALKDAGRPVTLPTGYRLRLTNPHDWLPDPATCGFCVARPPFRPGDVVLLHIGQAQAHLVIAGLSGTWIHAHAGLRRVVISPAMLAGTILGHWRPAPSNDE